MMDDEPQQAARARQLTGWDAAAVILGVVIGSGIFAFPSLVAANVSNAWVLLGLWLCGGAVALMGALCYAELSSTYPDVGGDYAFLRRAYGPELSFLFVWGRMTVIQTGAIAAAAFIGGNYLAEKVSLGAYSAGIYAALIVLALTALNLAGLRFGKWTQHILVASVLCGLLLIVITGFRLWLTGEAQAAGGNAGTAGSGFTETVSMIGLAMIFVLYSYGGWNEAAYLSAEVQQPKRDIPRALLLGIGTISLVYLLVNLALLAGLGQAGMADSSAVAADLMRAAWGDGGVMLISLLVFIAVLSTVNASIITGGRSNFALGRDYPRAFGFMRHWRERRGVPPMALLVQVGITLLLIALASGGIEEEGLEAVVAYTAPAFWLFIALVGLAVMILRCWDGERQRPFRVPFYPLTPFLFCTFCIYMLYSAIAHAGAGALIGLAVLLAGLPFLALELGRKKESCHDSRRGSLEKDETAD